MAKQYIYLIYYSDMECRNMLGYYTDKEQFDKDWKFLTENYRPRLGSFDKERVLLNTLLIDEEDFRYYSFIKLGENKDG